MFKVGDRVRCIDGWEACDPCVSRMYVIKGVRAPFLDFEFGTGWLGTRFEKVNKFKGNVK